MEFFQPILPGEENVEDKEDEEDEDVLFADDDDDDDDGNAADEPGVDMQLMYMLQNTSCCDLS